MEATEAIDAGMEYENGLHAGACDRSMRIELHNVEKVYNTKMLKFHALKGIDLVIEKGELAAIVGPSGSGKSTLLNMITGIDRPTSGEVLMGGRRIDTMKEDELARWRGQNKIIRRLSRCS